MKMREREKEKKKNNQFMILSFFFFFGASHSEVCGFAIIYNPSNKATWSSGQLVRLIT